MTLYILDTDHFSLNQRGFPALKTRLMQLPIEDVAITVITVEEQLKGWLAYISKATTAESRVNGYHRLKEAVFDFGRIQVLEYDASVDSQFHQLRQQKIRIGSQDLRIAAITLVHNGILVTRNTKDFSQVPGLQIEDWTV